MSKILIDNYTFNKVAKTVTFSDYGTIRLDKILVITNVTSNVIIYNFADPTLGGTVATNVLTLTYNTGSMANTDKLQIFYDDNTITTDYATQTTLAAIKTKTDNLDVALSTLESLTAVTTVGTITNVVHVDDNSSTLSVDDGGGSLTIDGSLTNISGTITLPTGAATAAKQPALGTAGTASADVITVQGKAAMTPLLVDGSGATQPVSGTVSVTGVATSTKQSDGTQKTQIVDGSGNVIGATSNALDVNIKSGASAGTQYTEDAASAADPVGNILIGRRRDTLVTNEVSADGDNIALNSTNKGQLHVKLADTVTVDASGTTLTVASHAVTNAGTFAVQAAQSGTWTVQPGNTANTTAWKVDGSAVTQPVSGTVTATIAAGASTIAKAEDVASASADVGVPAMAIQLATPTDLAGTDADYAMLQMAGGRLWVDASGKTLTVASHAVTNAGTFAVQATEADGANTTLGSKADAKSTATDTTAITAMSVLKQISASVQAPPSQAVTNAGTFAVQAAITAASGSVSSGAISSGAIASGAVASGAFASGSIASGAIVAGAIAAGATSFVKLEDVASADADAGVPALAVRKATPANTSGTDGDYEFLQMSAGRLWASATIDAALPAGTNVIGHVITDATSVTTATLAAETTKVIGVVRTADGSGNLLTSTGNALDINVKTGGPTQYTEDAAAAADPVGSVPILVRKDTPAATVSTDGDNIAQRGSNFGAAYVTLLDTSGSYVAVGGGTQYTEDVASTADPIGNMLIGRRRDTLTVSEVSTDGDNIALNATSKGQLHALTANSTFDHSADVTMQSAVSANANGSSLTITGYASVAFQVSGTFNATVNPEVSMDGGATWVALQAHQINSDAWGTSHGNTGLYHAPVGGFDLFRARVVWTSGTSVTVVGRAFNSNFPSLVRLATSAGVNASQTGTWNVGSSSATGSAVPANGFYQGAIAKTSLPAAATDGNLVGAISDKFGRQVVVPYGMRDITLPITQLTLTATTTETTLIGAVASTFNDILSLVVINTSATATQVDFRDSTGGTVRLSIYVPAGDTRGVVLTAPMIQNAVNNNWTAKCGTSVSSVIITGQYVANK